MASKMNFREIISFEEMLTEKDTSGAMDYEKAIGPHPEGVYFLLDNSYIMLLSGKVYKGSQ